MTGYTRLELGDCAKELHLLHQQAAQAEIVRSQKLHIESQLSRLGMHDKMLVEQRRAQIMDALGIS